MKNLELPFDVVLRLLSFGEITKCTSTETGSNYTFYLNLSDEFGNNCEAEYKPMLGEVPLWDFEPETLYLREYASYLVSEELKWNLIPTTTIRVGPFGIGSVQYKISNLEDENFFTLRDDYPDIMKKFNRYLEKKEKDAVINKVKEEIKLILYNNRRESI